MNTLHNPTSAVNEVPSAATIVSNTVVMNEELESIGEKLGEWKAYDAQLPLAEIKGTRIVKALYQTNKETGKKVQENAYVRIPTKHLTEEKLVARITELSPCVLSWLQEQEALSLRADHKKGQLNVFCANLSIDALIVRLEESEAGARLNKEKIEVWYDVNIMEPLTVLFAGKMNISENASEEQLIKLELVLVAYKAKFASLASGKVYIKEADCLAMIAVITNCEAQDSLLGARFISRLEKMQTTKDDLLLAL